MHIEQVTTDAVRPLRHLVLRPGQGFDETLYPGDDVAIHFAAFDDGHIVGIVSLYPNEPAPGQFRFRGMAVDPQRQGTGVGAQLIRAMLQSAWASGAERVWCNARTSALGFYGRHGFEAEGDEFEIAGIGPHRVLVLDRPAE